MDRRLGDLEQIQARMDYTAEYKNRYSLIQLAGPDSIVGRSLVIYERKDDWDVVERRATPYRDAIRRKGMGNRIGCCVVALVEDQPKSVPAPEPAAEEPAPEPSQPEPEQHRHIHGAHPALSIPAQQPYYQSAPPQYRPYQAAW